MISQIAQKYQRALCLKEESPRPPTEAELQALWFESFITPQIQIDGGLSVTIVQPGIWNRAAGPDFLQAAVQYPDGSTQAGSVEIHLRALDWEVHGHHQDGRYEGTLLHGVWFRPFPPYFPATREFRRVPQCVLSEHLIAPWDELAQILEPLSLESRPLAQPGLCQKVLAQTSPPRVLEILRAAGAWRLQRKMERLRWRQRAKGARQCLWESLAEALGYAQNKVALRTLAQRVPHHWSELKKPLHRQALLQGVSGFLPQENLSAFSSPTRLLLRPLWDIWWKERERLHYALLPRPIWTLANLRPNNRPERRIAALAALHPRLASLCRAIQQCSVPRFVQILAELNDPFWSFHSTWRSRPSLRPIQLLGHERIEDILLNIFWPLVGLEKVELADHALRNLRSNPNQSTRIAQERVLGSLALGRPLREALVQQGLLQVYQDFCLTDASGCRRCPFPEVVQRFESSD